MKFLKEHTLYIESELERFQLPLNPSNLYHPLRYFLNIGGKRIRPVLTLMAAELFGTNADKVKEQINLLQEAAIKNENLFELLMDATKYCTLGQITSGLFEVGGQYRRNM